MKKRQNQSNDAGAVCAITAGSPGTCCTVLDSVGEGVFTVDMDKPITFFYPAAKALGISRTTLWRKMNRKFRFWFRLNTLWRKYRDIM